MTTYIAERVTINPSVCNGKPCIRGLRVTVQTILEFLRAGDTHADILAQFPLLESADIDACLDFVISLMDKKYEIHAIPKAA
jgi:uncharacterized protein (DUF433 family)